ncbi:gene transfer agent family protein [Tardiphaga sp. vice278]|uniref:gene transfer agent family protein n=1 Tax=Tardiphaga sp. vice278 TaxID=2592815 RepID=UPI0011649E6A|nr:gene transfer agent family protein [Tardiphaga sp. vice278]QDM17669.1 gene transfer agent family protein [Tardiphaga sp. vice278]
MTDTNTTPKPMIWAGGEHAFTLNHPWVRNSLNLRGLAGDYGSTPAACFKRFEQGIFSSADVERVILLGLIGSGLSSNEAEALVDKFVRTRPVLDNSATAFSVLATLFTDAASLGEAA